MSVLDPSDGTPAATPRARWVEFILRQIWPGWSQGELRERAAAILTERAPGVSLAMEAKFARMQQPAARAAVDRALSASSAEMGAAAVRAAASSAIGPTRGCSICGAGPAQDDGDGDPDLRGLALCEAHWPPDADAK